MEKAQMERNLRLLGILFVLHSSGAIMIPTLALFWQKECGLSLSQFAWLQILFGAAMIFLEVPTGYFADYLGRKPGLLVGSILIVAGELTYSGAHGFKQCLLAELVLAVGFSLRSGVDKSILYDSLIRLERIGEHVDIWGSLVRRGFLMMAVMSMLGGVVATYSLRLPFMFSAAGSALALIPALMLHEPAREKIEAAHGHLHELGKIVNLCLFNKKQLGWLILFQGVLLGINQAALWYYQPYMEQSGVSPVMFGAIFAGFQMVAALASRHGSRLLEKLPRGRIPIVLSMALVASFALMGSIMAWWSFAIIFIQQGIRGCTGVIFADEIDRETTSDIRATTHSLGSMLFRVVEAAALLPALMVADKFGIPAVFLTLGVLSLVVLPAVIMVRPQAKESVE